MTIQAWKETFNNKTGLGVLVPLSMKNQRGWNEWLNLRQHEYIHPSWSSCEFLFIYENKGESIAGLCHIIKKRCAFISSAFEFLKARPAHLNITKEDNNTVQAFSSLYLLDNAPKSVVVASYRALMLEYHPDKPGGSEEKTKEINQAKDIIFRLKNW